jgi:hypothetical protein
MKFLVDENVPRPLVRLMQEHGHAVVVLPKGSSDRILFERAKQEGLFIITNDTDFLDTVKFPLTDSPGRIVLRIFPTVFDFQCARLEVFLATMSTLELAGRLIVLSADDITVREE